MLTAAKLSKLATNDSHELLLDSLLDVRPPLPLRARLRLADSDRAAVVALSLATSRVCELSWVWSTSINTLASKLLDLLDRGGLDGVGLAAARLALAKLGDLAPESLASELARYGSELDLAITRWIAYAERVAGGCGERGSRSRVVEESDDLERSGLEPDHALDAALILFVLSPLVAGGETSAPLHRLADMLEFSGDVFDPTIASLRRAADSVLCAGVPVRSGLETSRGRGSSAA